MPRYYTEDVVAKVAWWFGVLAGVLILVWSVSYPEFTYLAVLQLAMLLAGKWMYPEQRLGRVEDNPFQEKTSVQKRYTSGRAATLLSIGIGLAACLLLQLVLTSSLHLGIPDLTSNLLGTYTLISAAISESYLLHWGLQTNLSTFIHKGAGILAVPAVAVILHSFAYGQSGIALLVVAGSFLIFAIIFEYSKRLSVPIIVHLIINLAVVV